MGVYYCAGSCGTFVCDAGGYEKMGLSKLNGEEENGYVCEVCANEIRKNNVPFFENHSALGYVWPTHYFIFRLELKRPSVENLDYVPLPTSLLQLIIDYYASHFEFYFMREVNPGTIEELRTKLWYSNYAECVHTEEEFDNKETMFVYWKSLMATQEGSITRSKAVAAYKKFLDLCRTLANNDTSKFKEWFEPPPFYMESKRVTLQKRITELENKLDKKRQKLLKASDNEHENQEEIDLQFLNWQ